MSKLAIVTGGTRGIGKAISVSLKNKGFIVVANFCDNQQKAQELKEKFSINTKQWDVKDYTACCYAVEKIENEFGTHVSVLVNNAGITKDVMFHKMLQQEWQEVIDTNLGSCFNMCRAVINQMRKQNYGRIVNISSINAQVGQVGQANYSASKAGIIGFTKALAKESALKNITVNCIAPGYIMTEMVAGMPLQIREQIIATTAVKRLGEPEEIARAVEFLVDENAGFITGETLSVNGGQKSKRLKEKLLDIYSDYLISQNKNATAIGLSELLSGELSHDQITRFLHSGEYGSKELWQYVKGLVRQQEEVDEGVLIIDDTVEEKAYTDENEIMCWHYSYAKGTDGKDLGLNTGENNYKGLQQLMFTGNGVINIQAANNGPISVPHVDFMAYGRPTTVNILTDFMVGHNSIAAQVDAINIGDSSTINPPKFTINVGSTGNLNLLQGNSTIKFQHPDAVFKLENTVGDARIVTFNRDLEPPIDDYGIVELSAEGAKSILTIKGINKAGKLGQAGKSFSELNISGDTNIIIEPEVFAKNINLNSEFNDPKGYITFSNIINGNVIFNDDIILNAQEKIIGNIDFVGKIGKVNLAAGKTISGNVISTGGKNGELNIGENGEVKGNIGDESNGIKTITIQKGTAQFFAGKNFPSIEVGSLFKIFKRLTRLNYKPQYKSQIVVDQFITDGTGEAQFNDSVFIGKKESRDTIIGGKLKFKDDVWINSAVKKAEKIQFGDNKTAILAQNIEAQGIVTGNNSKVIIAENLKIITDDKLTVNNILLDLGNKTLTLDSDVEFKGTLIINTIYNSKTKNGNLATISDDKKLQFTDDLTEISINISFPENMTLLRDNKYTLISVKNKNNIVGLTKEKRPKDFVKLNVSNNIFDTWDIDENGNLVLYKLRMNSSSQTDPLPEVAEIANLTKQLGQVKEASATMQIETEKREEQLKQEVNKAQDEVQNLSTQLKEATHTKEQKEKDIQQLAGQLAQANNDKEKTKQSLENLTQQCSEEKQTLQQANKELVEQFAVLTTTKNTQDKKLQELNEQLKEATDTKEQKEKEIQQLTGQLTQANIDKEKTKQSLENLTQEYSEEKQTLQQANKELAEQFAVLASTKNTQDKKLQELNEQLKEATDTKEQKEKEIQQLTGQLAQANIDKEKTKQSLENLTQQCSEEKQTLQQANKELAEQFAVLTSTKNTQDKELQGLHKQLEEAKNTKEQKENEIEQLAGQLAQANNDKEKTKQSLENLAQQCSEEKQTLQQANKELVEQFAVLTSTKNTQDKELQGLHKQLEEAKNTKEQKENEIEQLAGQLAQANNDKEKTKQSLENLTQQCSEEKQTLQQANKELVEQFAVLTSTKNTQDKELQGLHKQLEEAKNTKEQKENEIEQLAGQLAQANNDKEKTKQNFEESSKECSAMYQTFQAEKETLQQQLTTAKNDLIKLEQSVATLELEIDKERQELPTLSSTKEPIIRQIFAQNAEQKEFANQLISANSTSDAGKFYNNLVQFDNNIADIRQASDRLIMRNIPASVIMWNTLKDMQPADQRISELHSIANHAVIGAGDLDNSKKTLGVWIAPFVTVSIQKPYNTSGGYKSHMHGKIFGADYLVNDSFILGVSYSHINTTIKYQDTKIGDTSKVRTDIGSLYGIQTWQNNSFLEGIFSYALSKVKAIEGRKTPINMEQTVGKYTATVYSGQLVMGYNYFTPPKKIIIAPILGLRYTKFKDINYKENGSSYQDLRINIKSHDQLEGITGVRVSYPIYASQMLIIPQLHGNINFNIKNKFLKIDARMDGIESPLPTGAFEKQRVFFNIGASLLTKWNTQSLEYGIQYNTILTKGYTAHQGSIKIKANF
ncbi:Acetoacetyl-CoA reductase [Pseudolycoriella hygida]|uniref:3-oxoacyl-[acyl-carrier-protein] reductase n=1 Tax=Pseudolycoriella hygida TaxID=35572 RepID=A0A9Q0N7F9_9DIPT|nr:Acetoacetyl-CoA reductase [Pseudolycoriella hygida]